MELTGREISHYHIIEPLGEGGMAVVYKAYDTHLDRTVALKMIRANAFPANDLEMIHQRFEREAKALARLSHPNIVGVIDFGEYEGAPYLVMEYLAGGSLKKLLDQARPWQQAVRLLLPIARALGYAHSQNIVHRDVKPSNILITQSGEPMLTDFGIAKILDLGPGHTLTSTGVGIGTPEYMAPEQGMGQEVDARADVYALGVVFYEMVTGRRPYVADTPVAVMFKHIMDPLPSPSQYAPGLPEVVEQVLIRSLAKQPADRYQTMELFVEALETLAGSATRIDEPLQPPATVIDPSPDPLPIREPASTPPPPLPTPAGGWQPPASPMRAGSIPSMQPQAVPPPPPGAARHIQPPGGALYPPARPYKKQMPPWLAVVLTLLIMGMISLTCTCIFSALTSNG
jgi:serine/threonine protein kinase